MAYSSTSFRPKWRTGPTTVIRIPEPLAEQVLAYARDLDSKSESVVREPSSVYRTARDFALTTPVNVASVPKRSPFRYPGGKTWLIPYIRSWLRRRPAPPSLLIEPFAGGAIVGLTAAFESLADHVMLIEKDPDVAAVWNLIFTGQAAWLAQRIRTFEVDSRSVEGILKQPAGTLRERAFATILKNRVQRGGIMAPGAGLVREGENGRGLLSRWYPETLARRILDIDQIRGSFSFREGDAFAAIDEFSDIEDAAFFVDPPYTLASRRLYQHWQVDHRALFRKLAGVKGDILLTYDNTREIADLAKKFLKDPITIRIESRATSENVEQDIIVVKNRDQKIETLHELFLKEGFEKILVFCRTKHGSDRLSKNLRERGFKADALHGDKSQSQRERALRQFEKDELKVLVATDVAARGLDIKGVTHVINYDVPETYEDYIHRIGRTGRAGKKGFALTFVD